MKLFNFPPQSLCIYKSGATRRSPRFERTVSKHQSVCADAGETVLTEHREGSWYQDRVGNRRLKRTVFLAFPPGLEPFRIGQESSKLRFALSQRSPLQNQKQIVVRVSDRDRPEPKLLDSMLLEKSQRIYLKAFQESWQPAGYAMEDS